MLYRQSRSQYHYKNGPFSIVPNLPGYAIPDHRDHGYGPLARFDDHDIGAGRIRAHARTPQRRDPYLRCGRPRATRRQLQREVCC
jgi:hypothetical protein